MSITIKEIAKICGVSRGTVDRALNDRPNINPETKEHILQVAKEMGYRPHFLAKSLVTGKTLTLGMMVFDLHNEFFASLIHAAQDEALTHGYNLNIMVTNKDKKQEANCLSNLLDRNVDGLIISSVNDNKKYLDMLRKSGKPCVAIGNHIDASIPFVGIDDYQAMYDATSYVLSRGYESIVLVCPPLRYKNKQNIYAPYKRYKGYKAAMSSVSKPAKTVKEMQDTETILAYSKTNKKTAYLCSSDVFALGITDILYKEYGHMPEHIGIMGFDHLSILRFLKPSLTTVSYPCKDVGVLAVRSLLNQISQASNQSESYFLPHQIVEGDTL